MARGLSRGCHLFQDACMKVVGYAARTVALLLAGVALMPAAAAAAEVTRQLPMPLLAPCARFTAVASNTSHRELTGRWDFGARSFSVVSAPGVQTVEPFTADHGTLTLGWPDHGETDGLWLWFRAQCSAKPEGPDVSWDCDKRQCKLLVTYQKAPTRRAPAAPKFPPTCGGVADGRAPDEACGPKLAALVRAMLVQADGEATAMCSPRRCRQDFVAAASHLRRLARAKAWKMRPVMRDIASHPVQSMRGRAVEFTIGDRTVSLVCIRETDTEGHPVSCGLEIDVPDAPLVFTSDALGWSTTFFWRGEYAFCSGDSVALGGSFVSAQTR